MSSCGSCGSDVPGGQGICSMCYGDPYYGNDGHYLRWLQEAEEEQQWEEEMARREEDLMRKEYEDAMRSIAIGTMVYDSSDISCLIHQPPFQSHTGEWLVVVRVLGYGDEFYTIRKLLSLRIAEKAV